jgi:hypothetical protein
MEALITLAALALVFILTCCATSYEDATRDQAYYNLLLGGHIHSGHS